MEARPTPPSRRARWRRLALGCVAGVAAVGLAFSVIVNENFGDILLHTGMPEPEEAPTEEPTSEPTETPESEPTAEPSTEPTVEPTAEPTVEPTTEPTDHPTADPSSSPSVEPSQSPSAEPSVDPDPGEPADPADPDPSEGPTDEEPLEEGIIEGIVALVIQEGAEFDARAVQASAVVEDTSEETLYVVHDEGMIEVDESQLLGAEPGDSVAVEISEAGAVENVEVLDSAVAAAETTVTNHLVDIVVLTPPGVAVSSYALAEVTEAVNLASAFWSMQTNQAVGFKVNKAVNGQGKLPSCSSDFSAITGAALAAAGTSAGNYLDSTLTVNGKSTLRQTGRHLLVVLPGSVCLNAWNGVMGMGTVGSGLGSGGYAVSFYSSDNTWRHSDGTTSFATVGADVVAHELGHNLGFRHAGSLVCTGAQNTWDPRVNQNLPSSSNCTISPYHDYLDVMGFAGKTNYNCKNCFGSVSAVQRLNAGISLGVKDVPPASGNVQVALDALSVTGGQRAVTATDNSTGERYVFELRAANGYDSLIGNNCVYLPSALQSYGVRVTKLVSGQAADSNNGSSMLVLNPNTPNPACNKAARATSFGVGQTFTSSSGNVVMTVNAISGTRATITISNSGPSAVAINRAPEGSFDLISLSSGGVRVAGWAVDRDSTNPLAVHAYVDGVFAMILTANLARSDIGRMYGLGDNHGFDAVVNVPTGAKKLCLYAINIPGGSNPEIGCKSIPVNRAPIGVIDQAIPEGSLLRVGGWALDPDASDSIAVHIYVDGRFATSAIATGARPDVGKAYGLGDKHGYNFLVPYQPGSKQVCAYGINLPSGGNPLLGCKDLPPNRLPFGSIDSVSLTPSGISAYGWALDHDTNNPVDVHIYVDNQFVTSMKANASRPDVGRVFGAGNNHGFNFAINTKPGARKVCLYGINQPAGPNPVIACKDIPVNRNPIGVLDVATKVGSTLTIGGWALDPDMTNPINVHVYVDGKLVTGVTANGARPDVGRAYKLGDNHGYWLNVSYPAAAKEVCVYGINLPTGANPKLGCRVVLTE